jgi:hypothetical protein
MGHIALMRETKNSCKILVGRSKKKTLGDQGLDEGYSKCSLEVGCDDMHCLGIWSSGGLL